MATSLVEGEVAKMLLSPDLKNVGRKCSLADPRPRAKLFKGSTNPLTFLQESMGQPVKLQLPSLMLITRCKSGCHALGQLKSPD